MKNFFLIAIVVVGGVVSLAQAGDRGGNCCPNCGCGNARLCCRIVPDVRKITTYQYDSLCDKYCMPGPSHVCSTKEVCDCTKFCGFRIEKFWSKPEWCGKMRTKKQLVKIPVTREKLFYTCKVERICCNCQHAMLDVKATERAIAQGIQPSSPGEVLVLDEHSNFENLVTVEATESGEAQPAAVAASAEEPAETAAPKSALRRLFSAISD